MKNKFKYGELVIVNGKGKIYNEKVRTFALVECKEYYYNEYLVDLLSSRKKDWFNEKDLKRVWERKNKKMEKFKVALAIEKRGLDIIKSKLKKMPDPKNNKLLDVDYHQRYRVGRKEYVILGWTSTYWPTTNYSVNCIQTTLEELRKENIAYQQIIVGETDVTYVKINEFIDNDENVNVLEFIPKIKIKKTGGILI